MSTFIAKTHANIKAEILSDPENVGYSTYIDSLGNSKVDGATQSVADLINSKTGNGTGRLPADPMDSGEFRALIDATEAQTLTLAQQSYFNMYVISPNVAVASPNVQAMIGNVFPVETCPKTNAAMTAAFTRVASRAEILFGPGSELTAQEIGTALSQS